MGSEELDHAEGAHTGFMILSDGVLSEYGHRPGGPGVCLGDGQTEAERVPSQSGRGDAVLLRMPPYLTYLTGVMYGGPNYLVRNPNPHSGRSYPWRVDMA